MAAKIGPDPTTQATLAKLHAFHDMLQIRALSAVGDIMANMRDTLTTLYPPKLASKWYIETGGSRKKTFLAGVLLDGNAKAIRGWEFGTPAHDIYPRSKRALAFQLGGNDIIVRHVSHPGTKPHNQRGNVQAAFAYVCRTEWGKALDGTIATLR